MIADRRMGYFRISTSFLNKQPNMVRQLMQAITVWKADAHYDSDEIEYFCTSEFFEIVPISNIAPRYEPIFTIPDGFEGFKKADY